MFEDLECEACANAWRVVWEAAIAHNIPVVLHDFPLSRHPWALWGARYARFFDAKSQKLGNDFRGYIYENQPQITLDSLGQYIQRFADNNKVRLPFAVDPEDKLWAKVQADYELGQRIGVEHVPTIFVVSNGGAAQPNVEVKDPRMLSQIIEDMLKKAGPANPAKHASGKAKKKPG